MCRRHFTALRLNTLPSQRVCVRIVHSNSILGIPLVNLKFEGIIYHTPKCAFMMQRNCWGGGGCFRRKNVIFMAEPVFFLLS